MKKIVALSFLLLCMVAHSQVTYTEATAVTQHKKIENAAIDNYVFKNVEVNICSTNSGQYFLNAALDGNPAQEWSLFLPELQLGKLQLYQNPKAKDYYATSLLMRDTLDYYLILLINKTGIHYKGIYSGAPASENTNFQVIDKKGNITLQQLNAKGAVATTYTQQKEEGNQKVFEPVAAAIKVKLDKLYRSLEGK